MKIYVVRGSEDGNIGAFTSYKKAEKWAVNYLRQDNPKEKISIDKREYTTRISRETDRVTAEIEYFWS